MATITGTNLGDTLNGTIQNDVITGKTGNDILSGGAGNDVLYGGEGTDTLYGGADNDKLFGGEGQDTLDGGSGNDIIDAGEGSDTAIYVVADNLGSKDIYDGGAGKDTLRLVFTAQDYARADVQIDIARYVALLASKASGRDDQNSKQYHFTSFDLTVKNFEKLDIVIGGQQATVLNTTSTSGVATLNLSTSTTDQTIATTGTGDTNITTGSGSDTVVAGNGDNVIDVGAGSNNVTTGSGDDVVSAGDGGNIIDVGSGNNTVTTGAGTDVIIAGAGDDVISSGAGNDFVEIGAGNDLVDAGTGDDVVVAGEGGGDDIIDGSTGIDTVTYPSSASSITIDLNGQDRSATITASGTVGALLAGAGYAANTSVGLATGADIGTDILINVENATGGAGNDSIIGNALSNVLSGAGGDDVVRGGGGDDIIDGGSGTDTAQYDQSIGAGYRITYDGTNFFVLDQFIPGHPEGKDKLVSIENLSFSDAYLRLQGGTAAGETLTGVSSSGNSIFGGDGNDTISGAGSFLNILVGDNGNDTIYGGAGYNDIWGVRGDDIITGSLSNVQDVAQYIGTFDKFALSFNDVSITVTDLDRSEKPIDAFGIPSDLNGLDEGIDTLTNVDRIGFGWGQTFYNVQTGGAGGQSLFGTADDDLMFAGSDNDEMNGGGGNDIFYGGAGNDTIDGGDGDRDTAVYSQDIGAGYRLSFDGTTFHVLDQFIPFNPEGDDSLYGVEFMAFAGGAQVIRILTGTSSDATITGDAAYANAIMGWSGNETLIAGGNWLDILGGYAGDDTLIGGAGYNDMWGLEDDDTIIGGSGWNVAQYLGSIDKFAIGFDDTNIIMTDRDASGTPGDVNDLNGGFDEGTDTLTNINQIGFGWGTSFYNVQTGSAGNDIRSGTNGADIMLTGSGDDTLYGGAGNDYLYAGAGDDVIDGGAGAGDVAVYAHDIGAGYRLTFDGSTIRVLDEFITSNPEGDDTIKDVEFLAFAGGSEVIRLQTGTSADATITGDASYWNAILGGGGNETLNGAGNGLDILVGYDGDDVLNGGAAFNDMWGVQGNDTIDGGSGISTAQYLGSFNAFTLSFDDTSIIITDLDFGRGVQGDQTNLNGGFDEGTDTLINIDRIGFDWGTTYFNIETGGAGSQGLIGTANADLMFAGSGNDEMTGGAGDDIIDGGAGDHDTAIYTSTVGGAGYRLLFDGASVHVRDDLVTSGSEGNDTLTGVEFVSFDNGNQLFRLQTGTAGGETISGVDTNWNLIFGGGGDDTLNASETSGVNGLIGDAGNDTLNGAMGFSELWGLEGNDIINGLGDQDRAAYIGTLDQFALSFDDRHVIVRDLNTSGGPISASNLNGLDEGTDTLTDVEFLNFAWGTDLYKVTTGDENSNVLSGDVNFANIIMSGSGNDQIDAAGLFNISLAGSGEDVVTGNTGTDYIFGQEGNDTLTGGSGADFFGYETVNFGHDVITDFEDGVDMFHLTFLGLTGYDDLVVTVNSPTETIVTLSGDASGLNSITINHDNGAIINVDDFIL